MSSPLKSSLRAEVRWLLTVISFAAAMNVGYAEDLVPSSVGTAHVFSSNRWGWCFAAEGCCSGSPSVAAPGAVIAGYSKAFWPGADPLPCHHTVEHRYASMIRFDIPPVPPIQRFILRPVSSRAVGLLSGRPTTECTLNVSLSQEGIFTASGRLPRTAPLFPGSFATDSIRIGPLTASDPPHPGIDLTSIAQQWQIGTLPNFGLVVSYPYPFPIDANALCLYFVTFAATVDFDRSLVSGAASDPNEPAVPDPSDFRSASMSVRGKRFSTIINFYAAYGGGSFSYYLNTDSDPGADIHVSCSASRFQVYGESPTMPGLFNVLLHSGTPTVRGTSYTIDFPLRHLRSTRGSFGFWFYSMATRDRMPDAGSGIVVTD